MLATLHFHKSLRKYTHGYESCTVEARTYMDLIRASLGLFPDLEKVFRRFLKGNNQEELMLVVDGKVFYNYMLNYLLKKGKKITLTPLFFGSGRTGAIIAVVAIIVIAAVAIVLSGGLAAGAFAGAGAAGTGSTGAAGAFAGAGAAATASVAGTAGLSIGTVIGLAVTVALTVASFLLAPTPTKAEQTDAPDAGARRNNDLFDGLQNTFSTVTPLSLNYGMVRTAGHFISGYILTVGHGKEDIIQVGDYFKNA